MRIHYSILFALLVFSNGGYSQGQKDTCKNLIIGLESDEGYWTTLITLEGEPVFQNNRIWGFRGFSEGLAGAGESSNSGANIRKFGFINTKGIWVIQPKYDGCTQFREGLCAVLINGKWGYIDKKGTLVIPAKYDLVFGFYEGVSVVRVGDNSTGKYGVIDKSGKFIVSPQFPANHENHLAGDGEYLRFVDGLCPMFDGQKWGYIDKSGKFEIPAQFFVANYFSEGLAAVGIAGEGVSFVNNKGEIKIKTNYDYTPLTIYYYFKDGFATYRKNNGSGLINKRGEVIVNHEKIIDISEPSENLMSFEAYPSRKWGVMDTSGRIIIETKYEYLGSFRFGYAAVKVKNPNSGGVAEFAYKWNIIDKKGNINENINNVGGSLSIFCIDE